MTETATMAAMRDATRRMLPACGSTGLRTRPGGLQPLRNLRRSAQARPPHELAEASLADSRRGTFVGHARGVTGVDAGRVRRSVRCDLYAAPARRSASLRGS